MKHIFFLFLATFVLVGCQPKEESDKRDEIDDNVITEEQMDTKPLYESNAKPRELQLRQNAYNDFPSFWNYYCWAKVSLDECYRSLLKII